MIVNRIRRRHSRHVPEETRTRDNLSGLLSITLALVACAFWSYWPTMVDLFKVWQRSDDYSAGQLVPLVALFLLWRERESLRKCVLKPRWVAGIALLMVAQAARMYGLVFMYDSAERYSIVVTIAGLVLMVAGWQVFRRVLWILLLLFLMVPLPGRIHNLISGPLQSIATVGAVFILEAFIKVSQEGNIVMLNDEVPMAVVEACSGLRMLMAFVIVAAFMAYMVKRSRLQKAFLLLSSVPVAVACNILRLCVTAILFLIASTEVAEKFFHDFAGFVMMPVAVLLMFAELWLMDRLIVPEPPNLQENQARAPTESSVQDEVSNG
ncbi:MAG: exosortase/archaeosortase family protein [Planctomycetota bacterium]